MLPEVSKESEAYTTDYNNVISQLNEAVKQIYFRYQKMAFYQKYFRDIRMPIVMGHDAAIACMIEERARRVADRRAKERNKRKNGKKK